MNESIVTFGRHHNLCGIVSHNDHIDPKTPAIIILNSGLVSKPGPFGLNTRLARQIAAHGFTVLRFDLSGIGDSPKHADNRDRHSQIVGDIQDAMDMMQSQYNIQTFIPMGICTGADSAHRIMREDERLSGAIFLDGYAYPTLKYKFMKHRRHLINPFHWLKAGIQSISHTNTPTPDGDNKQVNLFWSLPPKQTFHDDLVNAISRDIQLFYIFSGGEGMCTYKNQFRDSFPDINFKNQLHIIIMPDAHHLFITEQEREELGEHIVNWLQRKFIQTH